MAIQRNDRDERDTRMEILIERFQEAEKRALLKRGIELWTRAERRITDSVPLPAAKIN
jgi:hypothetical protein